MVGVAVGAAALLFALITVPSSLPPPAAIATVGIALLTSLTSLLGLPRLYQGVPRPLLTVWLTG